MRYKNVEYLRNVGLINELDWLYSYRVAAHSSYLFCSSPYWWCCWQCHSYGWTSMVSGQKVQSVEILETPGLGTSYSTWYPEGIWNLFWVESHSAFVSVFVNKQSTAYNWKTESGIERYSQEWFNPRVERFVLFQIFSAVKCDSYFLNYPETPAYNPRA